MVIIALLLVETAAEVIFWKHLILHQGQEAQHKLLYEKQCFGNIMLTVER
jgi:hypothetical protein